MPIPLEEHVRQILLENERGAKFHYAISEGWKAFNEGYPQRHIWRRKSSSRHIVWEEIVKRLINIAADDNEIQVIEHRDTISLVVEHEVLFRVKHADTSLLTANYPTGEAKEFDDHSVDLYDFKGLQRVRLCYVPDQFQTNLLWSGVAATNNGNFLWKIELDGFGTIAAPERLPLPETTANTSKLAKLKPGSQNAQKKDDEAG